MSDILGLLDAAAWLFYVGVFVITAFATAIGINILFGVEKKGGESVGQYFMAVPMIVTLFVISALNPGMLW